MRKEEVVTLTANTFQIESAGGDPVEICERSVQDRSNAPAPSTQPKLLIAMRVFGSSGQPWLWRQALGLYGFRRELLCWERRNATTQATGDVPVHLLSGDPGPYDGAARWWYRLRNLPIQNFYAAVGAEQRQLAELLRRCQPAVVLCNFGDIAMRLLPVAEREGVPLIAYFHGDFSFIYNRWYRWSLIPCLPRFAAIVVVTEAERQWMLEHGVPPIKIHLIPCGAPTEMFRPADRKSSAVVRFIMASRLSEDKGCDLSIRAFARVASDVPDARLEIYGDGPERANLERLVETVGLSTRIAFHGYVEEKRLAQILPLHDVFIQHSRYKEGSPVAIAEAMACGLPVVATPVGGIPDQVIEEKVGLLVAEGDVLGMAAAMRRLALDPQVRQAFGQAARDRAVSLYDSSLQTRRLEQVLMSVAGDVSIRHKGGELAVTKS
jgi:colanic acid/amylovoran biosynthesis glycosyltransferase